MGITPSAYCQSYIGWVTKQVNFREEPSTESRIIMSLKPGSEVFIVSLETEDDFYDVIDIKTNQEGYVYKSYVKVGEEVKKNDQDVFTPTGSSINYNPSAEVFNNTNVTMTLKLNSESFTLAPHEKRTLTLSPGNYNYRASAPNVIPLIGTDNFEKNMDYTWEFYIVTSYK
ncbi:MAG: SH3 domain-containing protein [Chitinophagales bacterium]